MDALEQVLEVATVASYAGTVTVASLSRFSYRLRLLAGTTFGTLFFTPILAPATIAFFPIPLSLAVVIGFLCGCVGDLPDILALAPRWNLIAMMCTAAVAAFITRTCLSGASRNGAEPTR